MQLYNTLSAEERAQLIAEAGKDRLTLSFYAYAKIEDPKKFRGVLSIISTMNSRKEKASDGLWN